MRHRVAVKHEADGLAGRGAPRFDGETLTVYVGSRSLERGQRAVQEIGGRARVLVIDVTVRLALLPDDGPTGQLFSWDGTVAPW